VNTVMTRTVLRAGLSGGGTLLVSFGGDVVIMSQPQIDIPTKSLLAFAAAYSLGCAGTILSSLVLYGMLSLRKIHSRPSTGERSVIFHLLVNAIATAIGMAILTFFISPLLGIKFSWALWLSYLIYGLSISSGFHAMFSYALITSQLHELRAKASEATLLTLESQLQPHFLFNAFNSLAELIATAPTQAEMMALKLSSFYRQILLTSTHNLHSLADELAICHSFLDIERIRLGKRLQYSFKVPESRLQLPCLVLQTLIENAIKHGITKAMDGGTIEVRLLPHEAGWWRLEVRNTGAPLKLPVVHGRGLQNALARLQLNFGEHSRLSLESCADGSTCVRVLLPEAAQAHVDSPKLHPG